MVYTVSRYYLVAGPSRQRRRGQIAAEAESHAMTDGSKEGVAGNRPRQGHRPDHQQAKVTPLRPSAKPRRSSLGDSEQRYRTLFDTMAEGFALHEIICDADGRPCDYRFLEVNPAFEQQSGLKAVDLIGRTIREIMPDIEPMWIERYGRVALTGKSEMFQASSEALGRDFEVRAYQAGPGRFATVFTDITGRKRAERTAHELALFPEQNPFPVLRIGTDGTLLYANAGSTTLLRSWNCQIGQAPPSRVRRAVEETLRTGKPDEIDIPCGSTLYSFAIAPIPEEGYANLYGRDVTESRAAEETLRSTLAEKQFLASIVERSSQAFGVGYPDGRLGEVNPAFEALTGYSAAELRTIDWNETLTPPEWCELEAKKLAELHRTGQPVCYQKEYIRKDGTRVPVELLVHLATDNAGHPQYYFSFITDITERKRAEELVTASERKYRELVETANSVVLRWDCDGMIQFVNGPGAQLLGYEPEELIGRSVGILVPDTESTGRNLSSLVQDILDHPEQYVCNPNENIGKDGRRIWIAWTNKPIVDEDGDVREILAIGNEITALKEAEAALRRSQEDLSQAQTVGQIGSWRLDIRRNALTWSDETCRIFGVPKGTPMTYDRFLEIIHPEDRIQVQTQWQACLRGEPYDIQHRIVVDGQIKWVREKAYLDFDDGKPVGGFGIVQDVTERKAAEQALHDANEQLHDQAEELAAINEELQTQTEELRAQAEELRKSEEALRSSEQRLRWALQGAAGGAWDWDLVTGQAWWSDEMYELWGVAPGTRMSLHNSLPIVLEEDRQRLQAAVEDSIARHGDYRCEFRIQHCQRGERWMASYGRLVRDRSGKPVRLLGISLDITERKQTEESIRRQGVVLKGVNRILRESLACDTDEEVGRACLAVTEEVTTSQFGFIGELNAAGLLDDIAISNPGWDACSMIAKDGSGKLPANLKVHGIYGRVLREGKGLFTNDPSLHPDRVGVPDGHPNLTAFLGVPLIHHGETVGMIGLGNRDGGYRQEDLEAVEALAPAVVEALMRKRAEQALRDSEQRLRTALEGGRMGLWEWDIPNDLSYGDDRVHELLHIYRPEPVPSEVFFDHVHHDDRERLRTQIQQALTSGEDLQTEFRAGYSRGEIAWLALRSRILCDDQERAVRMLGIIFDITQRKQMEDALCRLNDQLEEEVQAQTEELKNTVKRLQDEVARRRLAERDLYERSRLLEGFFRHTITPLAFMDREFNFVQVNDAYAQADEQEPAYFAGRNHFALYPNAENQAIFEDVVKTKQPYLALAKAFTYANNPERGVSYWNWQLTPLLDDSGEVRYLVLNLQDVTERQEAVQELEGRTSQLQRLTAELSEAEDRERQRLAELLHDDLQQLLVGSKLRLNILAKKTRNAPEILGIVEEATDLIAESIQKSRGLSHELSPPVLHHGDLREVLQWLIEQIHTTCGLKVRLKIGDGVDVHSQTLKTFTYKAAREMLFNVVKHANVKRAAIVVQQSDESLRLTVSDRGRGFESERLDIASQNGFGLFHIRERVQLLGGSMTVQSIPGRGSRIILTIPRNVTEEVTTTVHGSGAPAATTSTEPLAPPAAHSNPAKRRFRVLLVDDHKVMRDGLAALLEEEPDIEVIGQAGNGRDAITMTAQLKPDVVIMDVVMPIINGEEATRQIKERWPTVRILALSMLEEDATRERMILAGAEAFLSKAGPSEVIAAAIRHSS